MVATNLKQSTTGQRKEIMKNCGYQVDIKNEWVQWVTGDNSKTSLTTLSFDEADKILMQQTGASEIKENWAYFDYKNSKHKRILSLLYTMQWTVPNDRHGEVPDLDRFSTFLKSDRSPVKKPLKAMDDKTEVPKIIKALEGILSSKFKK